MASLPSSSSTQVFVGGGQPIFPASLSPQSGNYTLQLSDSTEETWILMQSASANNLTVPPKSMVSMRNGIGIPVIQMGAGTTTLVAGTNVTLEPQAGATLVSNGQYSVIVLLHVADDVWIASGDLVPA